VGDQDAAGGDDEALLVSVSCEEVMALIMEEGEDDEIGLDPGLYLAKGVSR